MSTMNVQMAKEFAELLKGTLCRRKKNDESYLAPTVLAAL